MSRTYYYARANTYSRKKKGFKFKWMLLLLIVSIMVIWFSGEIAPNIESVERSISQQIELIRTVQPSE